ncbi:MAG: universal stress protein [Acidobacteriota bacterium]
MYQSIYVPVDNSAHSNRAMDTAIAIGKTYGSAMTGCHVYAARMHDYRFKQMEFTLPEEYLVESELARQRKIHDSLISMGLELISDCYLNTMDQLCQQAGLTCERKMMDGKHSAEIINDIAQSDYDLVVLGVVGIGRTKDSQVGAVCGRVSREIERDTWVTKHVPEAGEEERDTIMVGVDGSPESFGALMTGIELAKSCGKKLEVVGVYDPYLHYAVFKGIVEVLTEKAAKIFRFEEQNQLHEEIIDTGLAEIYQSHINVAAAIARKHGLDVTKTLLDGKAFQKLLDHTRKTKPWVMIIGRVGVHAGEDEEGLGSNTENLLRLAPCDLLLTNRREVPELDLKAEESIHWTPEAEERMTRVPDMVKGIARTAILRLAIEQGHSVVSSDLVTEAMDRFMPKSSQQATEKLAEALAFEKAQREAVSLCKHCGLAARVPDPVRCTVCGAQDFEVITPEMVEEIAKMEGGVEEETTYDGRKLRWTQEAKKALRAIDDRYQRRRAKARIEKAAHGRRVDPITLDLAQHFIEEETGVLYKPAATPAAGTAPEQEVKAPEVQQPAVEEDGPELKILARDGKNNPLLSRLDWNSAAIERIFRVPVGYMRDKTQTRVEEFAAEQGAEEITLELVEEGIEHGLQLMAEMIAEQEAEGVAAAPPPADAAPGDLAAKGGGCPMAALQAGKAKTEPAPKPAASRTVSRKVGTPVSLNEVGVMSNLEKRRVELQPPTDDS